MNLSMIQACTGQFARGEWHSFLRISSSDYLEVRDGWHPVPSDQEKGSTDDLSVTEQLKLTWSSFGSL